MIHILSLSSIRIDREQHLEVNLTPVDGDITQVSVIDPENIDVGRKPIPKRHAMRSGRRIDARHLPRKVRKTGGRAALADIERSHSGKIVSERFKDVVEGLCGVETHQFEPVEIMNPSGHEDRHRWWFIPAVRLFAFDTDKIDPPLHALGFYPETRGAKDWNLTFRAAVVDGHHIFSAGELLSPVLWVDDAFVASAEAAELTGMRFEYSFPAI